MDLIFLSLRFSLVCPIRIFWNRSATATHTLRHRHFTAGVNFDRILAFFFLFISLNYAFFLLVFIQHQLDYITKSGKLKSKIKTYQIWKYRIACTGLVIYFECKAKKPANSNENFNAIKQKKSSASNAILLPTQPAMNFIYASIWWMKNNDEHDINYDEHTVATTFAADEIDWCRKSNCELLVPAYIFWISRGVRSWKHFRLRKIFRNLSSASIWLVFLI